MCVCFAQIELPPYQMKRPNQCEKICVCVCVCVFVYVCVNFVQIVTNTKAGTKYLLVQRGW